MQIATFINENIVWGAPMLAAMLSTGAYFSVKTGFFQLRRFGACLRSTVLSPPTADKAAETALSASFRQWAMCSSLAATLGTGNIVGVSAALAVGGAGAVFRMWVSALLGMMTGYADNVLGIYYRRKGSGGAMCYIKNGLGSIRATKRAAAPMAAVFAALCLLASFGMGNMAQMNSAAAMKGSFGVPQWITGAVLAAAAALTIFGGVKRIAAVTEKIVPFMSAFYIIGAAYILIVNFKSIPAMFCAILDGAFGIGAIGGGIFGAAAKRAVSMRGRRGVFSNEAGLGTSVAAHAPSAEEVLHNVTEVPQYFRLTECGSLITSGVQLPETLSCRTAAGAPLIAKTGGAFTFSNIMTVQSKTQADGVQSAEVTPVGGAELAAYAFSQSFGGAAGKLLAAAVVMFAFSTVVGWSRFGSDAAVYLFGNGAAARSGWYLSLPPQRERAPIWAPHGKSRIC